MRLLPVVNNHLPGIWTCRTGNLGNTSFGLGLGGLGTLGLIGTVYGGHWMGWKRIVDEARSWGRGVVWKTLFGKCAAEG
jgi:hypothetical protein